MTKSSVDFADVACRLSETNTVTDALVSIQSAYPVEFVTYHLANTVVAAVDAPFVRTTYPEKWVSRYLLNGYVAIDPIVREGFLRQLPFDWRELEISTSTMAFLNDALRHGVGRSGLSIPIADKVGRRAILSFNSSVSAMDWDGVVSAYRTDWIDIAHMVHKKAIFELHGSEDPIPALSARERECLHWSALGKDYKDIALILGISSHTTRSYIKSARSKLGCATISAAAALALKLRLIAI